MKSFNVILAIDKDNGIGKDGSIPWNIKSDMSYFKKMTTTSTLPMLENIIIMGRKTCDSLPQKFLPNRINYVVTKNKDYTNDNVRIFNSFSDAINTALLKENDIWVIGGAEIYQQSFRHKNFDKLYLTKIHKSFDCDTKVNLPKYNVNKNTFYHDDDVIIETIVAEPIKNVEQQYLQLIQNIKINGEFRQTRNAKTYSLFNNTLDFDLSDGFPLLTTKKMFWKGIVEELLFFIRGDTNSKLLEEKGVRIWQGNTSKEFIESCNLPYDEGDMGPMYGWNWRHFGADYKNCDTDYSGKGFDQLKKLLKKLKMTLIVDEF